MKTNISEGLGVSVNLSEEEVKWKNDLHATSAINSEKRLWRTCKSSTGGFNGETRLARMGRDDKGKDTEMA